jgi:hypothetical protein
MKIMQLDWSDNAMKRGEFVVQLVLALLGIAIFFFVDRMVGRSLVPGISPALFPKIAGMGMFITAGISIGKAVAKRNIQSTAKLVPDQKLLGVIAVLLGYFLLLIGVGFAISTIISMAAYLLIVGERNWLKLSLTPLLTTGLLYLVFQELMKVQLPVGVLFQ